MAMETTRRRLELMNCSVAASARRAAISSYALASRRDIASGKLVLWLPDLPDEPGQVPLVLFAEQRVLADAVQVEADQVLVVALVPWA